MDASHHFVQGWSKRTPGVIPRNGWLWPKMAIASVRDDQKPVGLYVHGWISMDLSGKISRESLGIMKCLKASGNSEHLCLAYIWLPQWVLFGGTANAEADDLRWGPRGDHRWMSGGSIVGIWVISFSGKPKFHLDAEFKFCWCSIWNVQWCSLIGIDYSSQDIHITYCNIYISCLCVCLQWGVYKLTNQSWSWQ
jgi:hypothetical protein